MRFRFLFFRWGKVLRNWDLGRGILRNGSFGFWCCGRSFAYGGFFLRRGIVWRWDRIGLWRCTLWKIFLATKIPHLRLLICIWHRRNLLCRDLRSLLLRKNHFWIKFLTILKKLNIIVFNYFFVLHLDR